MNSKCAFSGLAKAMVPFDANCALKEKLRSPQLGCSTKERTIVDLLERWRRVQCGRVGGNRFSVVECPMSIIEGVWASTSAKVIAPPPDFDSRPRISTTAASGFVDPNLDKASFEFAGISNSSALETIRAAVVICRS